MKIFQQYFHHHRYRHHHRTKMVPVTRISSALIVNYTLLRWKTTSKNSWISEFGECADPKKKNIVLHIHSSSTTSQTVSEQFVYQILEKCRNLVQLPNAKGETLLHIAARYGHSNIAKLLVQRVKAFPPADIENGIGADQKFIRATNDEKDTALHEAVRYHHIEVVKTLLQMDPDYSYRANNANETTLYLASQRQISKWWLRYQTKWNHRHMVAPIIEQHCMLLWLTMIYRLVPIKPGCVHLLCYSFIIIILFLCCSSALLFVYYYSWIFTKYKIVLKYFKKYFIIGGYSSSLFLVIFSDFNNILESPFILSSFLVELRFYVFIGSKFSYTKLKLNKFHVEREYWESWI